MNTQDEFEKEELKEARMQIAAMAMQGMCANPAYTTTPVEHVAAWAVGQADALLAELQKPIAPAAEPAEG